MVTIDLIEATNLRKLVGSKSQDLKRKHIDEGNICNNQGKRQKMSTKKISRIRY